jgi:hypothetical protein
VSLCGFRDRPSDSIVDSLRDIGGLLSIGALLADGLPCAAEPLIQDVE